MLIRLLITTLAAGALSCGNPVSEPDPVRSPITQHTPPPDPVPVVGINDTPPIDVVLVIAKRRYEGFYFVDWAFRNQMDQAIIMVQPDFQCNSPADGFTGWSAAVEEVEGYLYRFDPIAPGGTWVFRDFLEGDPNRNSLILFGDCSDRKVELQVMRTDEDERPYVEGMVYTPNIHVSFVERSE